MLRGGKEERLGFGEPEGEEAGERTAVILIFVESGQSLVLQ